MKTMREEGGGGANDKRSRLLIGGLKRGKGGGVGTKRRCHLYLTHEAGQ